MLKTAKLLSFMGLLFCLPISLPLRGQQGLEWGEDIHMDAASMLSDHEKRFYALESMDSAGLLSALKQLRPSKDDSWYRQVEYHLLWGGLVRTHPELGSKEESKARLLEAATLAYQSGDPDLIFFAGRIAGSHLYVLDELELSLTHLLKSEEVLNSLSVKPYQPVNIWLNLGEVLFHTGDYKNSIAYLKKGMQASRYQQSLPHNYLRDLNAVGQAYQKIGAWDSALLYFDKSDRVVASLPESEDRKIWIAINAAFRGQVLYQLGQLDSAQTLLEHDYLVNRNREQNVAAYSLNWLARIQLHKGNRLQALKQIREAIFLLRSSSAFKVQKMGYLREVYFTAMDIYRALGNADSLYQYTMLYRTLDDSLQQIALKSSLGILNTKLEHEKTYQEIIQLRKEKEATTRQRNLVIACIVLLSFLAIMTVNRLRIRQVYRERMIQQQNKAAEERAREQLALMTRNFLEKAAIVENMQEQLEKRQHSTERQELVRTLSHLTILTEEDWERFRDLFEQLHPGFFLNLKETVSDITVAELRMAALTRLQLSTQQIASILGISPNSVYKTKQRLRQRLQLSNDASVEERLLEI